MAIYQDREAEKNGENKKKKRKTTKPSNYETQRSFGAPGEPELPDLKTILTLNNAPDLTNDKSLPQGKSTSEMTWPEYFVYWLRVSSSAAELFNKPTSPTFQYLKSRISGIVINKENVGTRLYASSVNQNINTLIPNGHLPKLNNSLSMKVKRSAPETLSGEKILLIFNEPLAREFLSTRIEDGFSKRSTVLANYSSQLELIKKAIMDLFLAEYRYIIDHQSNPSIQTYLNELNENIKNEEGALGQIVEIIPIHDHIVDNILEKIVEGDLSFTNVKFSSNLENLLDLLSRKYSSNLPPRVKVNGSVIIQNEVDYLKVINYCWENTRKLSEGKLVFDRQEQEYLNVYYINMLRFIYQHSEDPYVLAIKKELSQYENPLKHADQQALWRNKSFILAIVNKLLFQHVMIGGKKIAWNLYEMFESDITISERGLVSGTLLYTAKKNHFPASVNIDIDDSAELFTRKLKIKYKTQLGSNPRLKIAFSDNSNIEGAKKYTHIEMSLLEYINRPFNTSEIILSIIDKDVGDWIYIYRLYHSLAPFDINTNPQDLINEMNELQQQANITQFNVIHSRVGQERLQTQIWLNAHSLSESSTLPDSVLNEPVTPLTRLLTPNLDTASGLKRRLILSASSSDYEGAEFVRKTNVDIIKFRDALGKNLTIHDMLHMHPEEVAQNLKLKYKETSTQSMVEVLSLGHRWQQRSFYWPIDIPADSNFRHDGEIYLLANNNTKRDSQERYDGYVFNAMQSSVDAYSSRDEEIIKAIMSAGIFLDSTQTKYAQPDTKVAIAVIADSWLAVLKDQVDKLSDTGDLEGALTKKLGEAHDYLRTSYNTSRVKINAKLPMTLEVFLITMVELKSGAWRTHMAAKLGLGYKISEFFSHIKPRIIAASLPDGRRISEEQINILIEEKPIGKFLLTAMTMYTNDFTREVMQRNSLRSGINAIDCLLEDINAGKMDNVFYQNNDSPEITRVLSQLREGKTVSHGLFYADSTEGNIPIADLVWVPLTALKRVVFSTRTSKYFITTAAVLEKMATNLQSHSIPKELFLLIISHLDPLQSKNALQHGANRMERLLHKYMIELQEFGISQGGENYQNFIWKTNQRELGEIKNDLRDFYVAWGLTTEIVEIIHNLDRDHTTFERGLPLYAMAHPEERSKYVLTVHLVPAKNQSLSDTVSENLFWKIRSQARTDDLLHDTQRELASTQITKSMTFIISMLASIVTGGIVGAAAISLNLSKTAMWALVTASQAGVTGLEEYLAANSLINEDERKAAFEGIPLSVMSSLGFDLGLDAILLPTVKKIYKGLRGAKIPVKIEENFKNLHKSIGESLKKESRNWQYKNIYEKNNQIIDKVMETDLVSNVYNTLPVSQLRESIKEYLDLSVDKIAVNKITYLDSLLQSQAILEDRLKPKNPKKLATGSINLANDKFIELSRLFKDNNDFDAGVLQYKKLQEAFDPIEIRTDYVVHLSAVSDKMSILVPDINDAKSINELIVKFNDPLSKLTFKQKGILSSYIKDIQDFTTMNNSYSKSERYIKDIDNSIVYTGLKHSFTLFPQKYLLMAGGNFADRAGRCLPLTYAMMSSINKGTSEQLIKNLFSAAYHDPLANWVMQGLRRSHTLDVKSAVTQLGLKNADQLVKLIKSKAYNVQPGQGKFYGLHSRADSRTDSGVRHALMVGVTLETGEALPTYYLYDPNFGVDKFWSVKDFELKVKATIMSPQLAVNYRANSPLTNPSYQVLEYDSDILGNIKLPTMDKKISDFGNKLSDESPAIYSDEDIMGDNVIAHQIRSPSLTNNENVGLFYRKVTMLEAIYANALPIKAKITRFPEKVVLDSFRVVRVTPPGKSTTLISIENVIEALKNYNKEYKLIHEHLSNIKVSDPKLALQFSQIANNIEKGIDISDQMISRPLDILSINEFSSISDTNTDYVVLIYNKKEIISDNNPIYGIGQPRLSKIQEVVGGKYESEFTMQFTIMDPKTQLRSLKKNFPDIFNTLKIEVYGDIDLEPFMIANGASFITQHAHRLFKITKAHTIMIPAENEASGHLAKNNGFHKRVNA